MFIYLTAPGLSCGTGDLQSFLWVCGCVYAQLLPSCLILYATLWLVTHQAPLTMGFSRQEYWSGFPCSLPGDLPNPGIELKLVYLMSLALAGRFFATSTTWEAHGM